ncbi:unnamed protein product [Rotaria magnacalcarata]|uniref:Ubiquitin-like domain-containing protein n=1 Tax=Rotaria magnacalcarata TaxID=392030 RepID=A0A816MCR9_9BILA|nr:unnamed protein product [Rotaria magnacalcarata]
MDNEFAVIKVRKQELNNTNIKSYENNVRISYAYDNERNPSHICIIADSEYIWAQTLQELEWLTVSSIDGVATIRSLNSTVIILYDKTNQTLADFFASLQAMLVHEPNLALSGSDLLPSNQGHAESSMIDELINVINTGAVDQTELIARKIATSKVNVQFNLLNKNDKEETRKAGSKSAEIKKESSDHILELTLSIESLMEHDPIIAPITVSSGTTLQSLKEQIENQSGIKSSSQYWFAFKRYPIPNDYIFGSSLPVVSIQQQQQQQQQPSINYIRSGDTLILTGRANIRIKDEKDPGNIRNYSNVKLQLTTGKSDPNLILQLPIDNEVVGRFNLRDCSYLDRSSSRGVVECIRNNSTEEILLILNSTEESAPLLEHMRNYLMAGPEATRGSTPESARRPAPEPARGPSPTPIPAPISNEDVNRLISALNENNTDEASRFARKLASNRAAIQFSLDMINEHGNAAPRQPPKPVIQPLKLKLAIESFLIDQCTDEKYDVAILPETTINDLKQIVYRDTEISVQQQYWFINREHLTDTYTFGVTTPLVNENTVLTLYIAKPQQN